MTNETESFDAVCNEADGCPTEGAVLKREWRNLRAELERERLRLAACGVVALANTADSAEKARMMHDDYRSASCDDVARAVDCQMELRAALTAVMNYPGIREYVGGQISGIADAALMGPNVEVRGCGDE